MTVGEGNSVTISTGAPVPSITWMLNGQPVTFDSSETITTSGTQLVRRNPNDPNSEFIPVSISNTVSSLTISNAQYPDHDGNYTCTGTNDDEMIISSSDTISVQVIGKANVFSVYIGRGLIYSLGQKSVRLYTRINFTIHAHSQEE